MSSQPSARPSTPGAAPQAAAAQPPPPQPGTWTHPHLSEIARRRNASTFTNSNVQKILYNLSALLLPPLLSSTFPTISNPINALLARADPITYYTVLALRLLFLYNITTALLPLIKTTDDLTDIALTPSQRALLGLDPNATPTAPAAATTPQSYSTPPRYPRSATPRTGSPRGSITGGVSPYTDSPLSYKRPDSTSTARNGSPFSPSVGAMNPVLQRALSTRRESLGSIGAGGTSNVGEGGRRRESFGYQSPLARSITAPSLTDADFGMSGGYGGLNSVSGYEPATPSPVGVRRGGPGAGGGTGGISSRWLFERSRGSPGSVSSMG